MPISTLQKTALKRRAHDLKPVVLLGQHGLTEAVLLAIDEALAVHELIKIKLAGIEKDQVDAIQQGICQPLGAEVVCHIGHMLVIYRKRPKADIKAAAKKRPAAKRKPFQHKTRMAKTNTRRS